MRQQFIDRIGKKKVLNVIEENLDNNVVRTAAWLCVLKCLKPHVL